MIRILGLDFGTKNIGVALSDEMGWTAQPLCTVPRRGDGPTVAALCALCAEHGVQEIVMGHPLNMDGSAGPSARMAEKFAEALGKASGLPVHLWDERLSTVAAERTLIEADLSRQKRRKVIDRAAAAYILQGYLDFRSRAPVDSEQS